MVRSFLFLWLLVMIGCSSSEAPSPAVEPVTCATLAYSVAIADGRGELVRQGAALWNAALDQEVFVESSGAPAVMLAGEPCGDVADALGYCSPEGSIALCEQRIHADRLWTAEDRWRAVAAHELGHRLIGQRHLSDPYALMGPYMVDAHAPTDSDIAGAWTFCARAPAEGDHPP